MLVGVVRFVGVVLGGLTATTVLGTLIAGLLWALWHYIGWPLPDHVPTWAEVQGTLHGPMTTTLLLDVLACVCWLSWAAFTIDVIRCTVNVVRDLARESFDRTRMPTLCSVGPVRALTRMLVGAVLLSVLGNRPAPAPATSPVGALGAGTDVVATAPAWHIPHHGAATRIQNILLAARTAVVSADDSTTADTATQSKSVVVRAPENGVHDSLWRIAQRTVGDGARWPETFELNKGKPQLRGHTFTNPALIFPGEELQLPADADVSPPQPQDQPHLPESPEPTTPPPATTVLPTSAEPSSPTTPVPTTHHTQDVPRQRPIRTHPRPPRGSLGSDGTQSSSSAWGSPRR